MNEIFSGSETGGHGARRRVGATRPCIECGKPYRAARRAQRYCSSQCRTDHLNRRSIRGSILYDLYMAHRWERDEAKRLGVLKAMNRLASDWRREDREQREGRRSWGDWKEFLATRADISLAVRMVFGDRK